MPVAQIGQEWSTLSLNWMTGIRTLLEQQFRGVVRSFTAVSANGRIISLSGHSPLQCFALLAKTPHQKRRTSQIVAALNLRSCLGIWQMLASMPDDHLLTLLVKYEMD